MEIDRSCQGVCADGSIARLNSNVAIQRAGFDRPVSRMCIKISVLRHAYLDVQPPPTRAPGKAPMTRPASHKLDLIAALVRLDVQVLVHLVALVLDAKLDRFGVSSRYPDPAVIRINAH